MGFWGGSSGDDSNASSSTQAKDFSSVDESSSFPSGGGDNLMSSAPSAGGAQAEMQQFAMALQQQSLIQKAITNICDVAFEKCVTGKPSGDSLSSKEVVCISSTTNKWLDTNEFMIGRLGKKQQQAQQSPGFG